MFKVIKLLQIVCQELTLGVWSQLWVRIQDSDDLGEVLSIAWGVRSLEWTLDLHSKGTQRFFVHWIRRWQFLSLTFNTAITLLAHIDAKFRRLYLVVWRWCLWCRHFFMGLIFGDQLMHLVYNAVDMLNQHLRSIFYLVRHSSFLLHHRTVFVWVAILTAIWENPGVRRRGRFNFSIGND